MKDTPLFNTVSCARVIERMVMIVLPCRILEGIILAMSRATLLPMPELSASSVVVSVSR